MPLEIPDEIKYFIDKITLDCQDSAQLLNYVWSM